jgi:hypothetical protein
MSDRQKYRKIRTERMAGASDVLPNSYNMYAGGLKVVGPIAGLLTRIGAATVAKQFDDAGLIVAIYNDSATTAWAILGDDLAAVAAVPSSANGIALKPYDYTYLALGEFKAYKASGGYAYLLEDDTYVA